MGAFAPFEPQVTPLPVLNEERCHENVWGHLPSAFDEVHDGFTLRPLYPREKGTQNQLEPVWGLSGIEARFPCLSARKLVTILTELSRLLLWLRLDSKCLSGHSPRQSAVASDAAVPWGWSLYVSSVKCPQNCRRSMTVSAVHGKRPIRRVS